MIGVAKPVAPARVLLVDDTALLRLVARQLLERRGLHVEEAENGAAAVARVAEAHFDLVLMDVEMPVMDGYRAAAKIREMRPDLPIVALTAHAVDESNQLSADAGMSDHLAKPLDEERLHAVLTKWLRPTDAVSETPPPPAQRIPPSSIDGVDVAAGVARMGGDEALFFRFLADFPAWARIVLADIRAALAAGDMISVEHAAHKLRGTAATSSAVAVGAAAAAIETAARENAPAEIEDKAQAIDAALHRIAAAISASPKDAAPAADTPLLDADEILRGDAAQALLTELRDLLERNDFGALKAFDAIAALFPDGRAPEPVSAIGAAVAAIEFDAARMKIDAYLRDAQT